ncbi:MAG: AAA family ATPase, partial [Chloroflexi bacterium]|nr:AAA family ATPase [Chloroflexota bacterium]
MTGCQRCGTLNADDARFCASCGSRLSTSCAVCGNDVAPDARFCPSCGEAVTRSGPTEERKVATVLFADVAGFTALGEALDPEVLRGVMGDYFAAMRAEIAWHGGSVEKFIGDAVVAVFGVPRASEDDVSRALRCALGMRRRLDELNTSLSRRVGVRLEMRIGVNTGEVLARPGAGPEEGLVTGDAVTVAARLEQLADPGRIVASERTARAARGFSFGPADQRHLKGRHEPVRIHELLGEPASELEVAAPVTMPLVDREEPLAFLTGILERAIEERAPRLVLIVGEPGTGKSRLAVELAHRAMARTPPARVLRGRCRPPTEASPYAPLGVALKKECGVLDDDRTPDALARIRESVSAIVGEEADRTVAALGWSIGLEDPDHTLRDLPARQVRYETLRAWRAWVEAIVRSGPAILVVEDLHWADPALLDLLEDLVERAEGPLLILGPSRPEVSERAPGWGRGPQRVHELPLDPLQPVHAEEIVRQLPGGDTLQPEEQRRIVARAEGNPFFLEELVHSVSDVHDDARHSSGRLPDTVQAVLAARIDRLPALDKRTLQLAAVCGRAFWPGLVRELSGIDGTALDPAFGRLVDRSLIVAQPASRISGEREYVFRHALTQEVAYAMLPRRERARAHAGVSRWLEATVDDRRREFELLAHHDETAHHLAVADPEAEPDTVEALRVRALDELLEAASDARSRSTVDAAQGLAERALQLARNDRERSLALEALGEAYLFGFWGDRAWETLRQA